MITRFRMNEKALSWLQVAILVFASFVPFIATTARVEALEVEQRSIDMLSSAPDAETDYTVSFVVPDSAAGTDNIGSFRIEFCDSSPIPGTACTNDGDGDDIPCVAADQDAGSDGLCGSAVTLSGGTFGAGGVTSSFASAPALNDNTIDIALSAQEDIDGQSEANRTYTVTLNDIDNPDNSTDGTNNNQFYARIYVFSDTGLTSQVHEGGVALSTAEQITVTARVQETLDFCVGDTQGSTTCASMSGSDIDLGVLSNSIVNQASEATATTNATDTQTALVQVTTNAANGVVISYLATPLTADGTTSACGTYGSASTTDLCINERDALGVISAGTEGWGIMVDPTITDNGSLGGGLLSIDAAYDWDATNAGGAVWGTDNVDYLVNVGATSDVIASSAGVVDSERLSVDAAATAQLTTPTGLYSSTLTFVATSTF